MNFPEKVDFKLIDHLAHQAVINVAISLKLYAARKNDYFVEPIISDQQGIVAVSRADCLQEIKNSRNFYLMDYSSNLEECLPKVTLEIMSPEQIRIAIEEMKKNAAFYKDYWNCSEDFLKRLENVSNNEYMSDSFVFEEAQLHRKDPLVVEVRRKSS